MNQNNLTDLENLKNLKYRFSLLMPNKKDNIFDVVFSDTDYKQVKKIENRLKELGYETVVHSEAFWNGYWEHEIDVIYDINMAKSNYPAAED